jgi:phospho-N-acetylmuramoyl-pentapeptide-transferase
MGIQVKVLVITFILTVILAFIIIPILKKLKVGQMERDDGPESHIKKQGTPTMGGIIMIIAIIICIIGAYIYCIYQGNTETANNIIPMLILSVGFGSVGFIDDFKKLNKKNTEGLKPSYKMLGLLLISVIYVLLIIVGSKIGTQTYIPFLKIYIDIPIYLYIPFAVLVILATTNAVNLTDGVDGLSSSVCAIIITCLTVIGMIFNIKEVVIFGSAVIGAVLGFLMFNLHPAKVFMGDTGSLFLGGVISVLALYLKVPLLLLIIALIPVLETLSVILQVAYFKKTGNRIFKMAPLHHHFELSGWKESKIVIVFSLITLILCIIGLKAI